MPCRHCLRAVAPGEAYLILAHRPFPWPQPHAETGPIFLRAEDCPAWHGANPPPILTTFPDYPIKGYGANWRIRYGTGAVVAAADLPAEAEARLADPATAFVDVRSARNNCYQLRIRRAPVPG